MNLTVKNHHCVLDPFNVDTYCTVHDLKVLIKGRLSLEIDEQTLIYDSQTLTNDAKLSDYGITDKCEIKLIVHLKKDGIKIIAKTMDVKTIEFEMTMNDTIIDIKKKIHEKIGISPDEQKLVCQGGILEDGKTVDYYQIVEKSVINVVARLRGGMQIFAKTMDGKTVTLEVTKNDTIIDIKTKIHEKIGLSPDEQKLVYNGVILEDDKIVDYYQIVENSVINVVARLRGEMKIFAKTMDGKTITFEVKKNDTIIDIKKKIHERIGIPPDEHKLVFQGEILEDDKTVDYYHIAEKSVINVVARLRGGLQIFGKTMDGKTVAFEVTKNERIIDMKKRGQEYQW